jgi:hypothetical protein
VFDAKIRCLVPFSNGSDKTGLDLLKKGTQVQKIFFSSRFLCNFTIEKIYAKDTFTENFAFYLNPSFACLESSISCLCNSNLARAVSVAIVKRIRENFVKS